MSLDNASAKLNHTERELQKLARLHQRLIDIENRARLEVSSRLKTHFNRLAAERAVFGADVLRMTAARGLQIQSALKDNPLLLDSTIADFPAVPTLQLQAACAEGDDIHSELWLCDQVTRTLKNNGSHTDLMSTLDSCARARQGSVLVKPNHKR